MNCPYCHKFMIPYHNSINDKIHACDNDKHHFYYKNNSLFSLVITDPNLKIGCDLAGFYLRYSNSIITINPFNPKDSMIVLERYKKLLAFS